jgi:hypothetical protein
VRGAAGACLSSDARYLKQPSMNWGHSGTTGTGSDFSGNKPPQRRVMPTKFVAGAVPVLADALPKSSYLSNELFPRHCVKVSIH